MFQGDMKKTSRGGTEKKELESRKCLEAEEEESKHRGLISSCFI